MGETRILGLAAGGGEAALSGIPHHLLEAVDRRFDVVGRLDYAPRGLRRVGLAAVTFRPSRSSWRSHFHNGSAAHRALTRTLSERASRFDRDFDLALQIFGWTRGQPRPYALYLDQTRLMAERGWPGWLVLPGRERAELLALERTMYEEAHHIFVMAGAARDSLVADYGIDSSRVTPVGGGLNFDSLPPRAEPALGSKIVFVGRDFERKGGDCLIRAFEHVREHLPEATLHIVGFGGRFREPGVIVHGMVWDRRQLTAFYRDARVVCLPSRYEPYGLSLIEAMAHGVPCVGTTVQAIPEILDRGRAGLLVEPGDPDALADALLTLLTDRELAIRLGEAGRRFVEGDLTWDHVVARMAPVLSRV